MSIINFFPVWWNFSYLVLEGQPASLSISFYLHFWWLLGGAEEMCSFFTNGKGQHCNKI